MIPHEETHPLVMEMMDEYYKQFDYIMGRQICTKAGIRIADLRIGNTCLNYILSKCNKEGCIATHWHPKAYDALPAKARVLCNKLRKGVNKMTRANRTREW